VGAFERKLVTPSRWDKFLEGDRNALTAEEKAGLQQVLRHGLRDVSSGGVRGRHVVSEARPREEAWPNQKDTGPHQVTKQGKDKMMFKTPSLRNIEKTAPYLHDGSVASARGDGQPDGRVSERQETERRRGRLDRHVAEVADR
jgi:cytochrome c peroxidase